MGGDPFITGVRVDVGLAFAKRLQQAGFAAAGRAEHQYLQRLTALAHSIGLEAYLAGATTEACIEAAWSAGFDGVTGPGVARLV